MSKKGFTLVELIGVIVILALLALLITPTVNKLLKEQKQKVYDAQMKIVLNAAKNYVADKQDTLDISSSGLVLSVSDLYNNGYLNKDKVINPSTNKEFKNCILVKWDDSYNQYNYKYVDCTTLADIDINASDDDPEYTVLSYLQSTGTQYIDTGFKANNNTSVETQVMFSENKTAAIYCSRTGLNSSSYSLFTIGGLPTRFDYSSTTYSSSYTPTLNTKVKRLMAEAEERKAVELVILGMRSFRRTENVAIRDNGAILMPIAVKGSGHESENERRGGGDQREPRERRLDRLVRRLLPVFANATGQPVGEVVRQPGVLARSKRLDNALFVFCHVRNQPNISLNAALAL